MLFNTFLFIYLFLPISVIVYFALIKWRLILGAKTWLVLTSLFFYSYWDYKYLPIILCSMLVNYGVGTALSSNEESKVRISRKVILLTGVIANLALLGYFKYTDFFITNVNSAFGLDLATLNLVLPLAISFFTFQQVAYLIDSYRNETHEYDFLNYCLFVTFFPQLIAGPIVHHKEMMPQFDQVKTKALNWKNIYKGLFIFAIGLFKKVVVADSLSEWVIIGFDQSESLTFFSAWFTSLSYTLKFIMIFLVIQTWLLALLYFLTLNFQKTLIHLTKQSIYRTFGAVGT